MKIHPVAEMFPMMSEEELDELAEDIKQNGLLNPIIKDKDDVLIDGRNRLEACKRAGVEPSFGTLNGVDPVAFIMSSNDRRRHMKLGQRAMIGAKVAVLNTAMKKDVARVAKVSAGYVAHASLVLQFASDMVDGVISGAIALNDAYAKAQKRSASLLRSD
jgi:ParB-like nuclease domain